MAASGAAGPASTSKRYSPSAKGPIDSPLALRPPTGTLLCSVHLDHTTKLSAVRRRRPSIYHRPVVTAPLFENCTWYLNDCEATGVTGSIVSEWSNLTEGKPPACRRPGQPPGGCDGRAPSQLPAPSATATRSQAPILTRRSRPRILSPSPTDTIPAIEEHARGLSFSPPPPSALAYSFTWSGRRSRGSPPARADVPTVTCSMRAKPRMVKVDVPSWRGDVSTCSVPTDSGQSRGRHQPARRYALTKADNRRQRPG